MSNYLLLLLFYVLLVVVCFNSSQSFLKSSQKNLATSNLFERPSTTAVVKKLSIAILSSCLLLDQTFAAHAADKINNNAGVVVYRSGKSPEGLPKKESDSKKDLGFLRCMSGCKSDCQRPRDGLAKVDCVQDCQVGGLIKRLHYHMIIFILFLLFFHCLLTKRINAVHRMSNVHLR